MILIYNGEPHRVMEFHHRSPGKGAAFVRALLRNLSTGASYERRFSSGDSVERATLEQYEAQFLYQEGSFFYFMNTENFDQFPLEAEMLGDSRDYLKEGTQVEVKFFKGRPIAVQMPATVELQVVETEPELRGATANNSSKPATLETGAVVQVPPFIREGELIRVDPVEGRYLERAK